MLKISVWVLLFEFEEKFRHEKIAIPFINEMCERFAWKIDENIYFAWNWSPPATIYAYYNDSIFISRVTFLRVYFTNSHDIYR